MLSVALKFVMSNTFLVHAKLYKKRPFENVLDTGVQDKIFNHFFLWWHAIPATKRSATKST